MRILFLTQVLPYPLDAGPKIRAYYVLRHLAEKHDVTLVSFVRATDTPDAIAHLGEYCNALHTVDMPRSPLLDAIHLGRSLLVGEPFIIARDWVDKMAQLLATLVKDDSPFDAIHADQLWMAPYAQWVQKCTKASGVKGKPPKLVLDQHNAVYMIPKRLSSGERNPLKRALMTLETRKLARFEAETCLAFDDVAWVTQEDFDAVQNLKSLRQKRLPNSGIIPICGDAIAKSALERSDSPQRVTFLGGLHYPPNAQGICWYAKHVFPKVLAQMPDAILTVLGKQPPKELHQLGIPAQNLDVTGFVDDPVTYLTETAAFVVPLQAGGGMRVKILDAWMWGVPIVSTTVGAEGIQTQPDKNILIADSVDDLVDATLSLLKSPQRASAIAAAGRKWAEEHYHWRTVYHKWDEIYR